MWLCCVLCVCAAVCDGVAYVTRQADAGEAIARNDKYSKAFALRGQARAQLKNYEDACMDYQSASDLSPESSEFKASLKEAQRNKQAEERVNLYERLGLSRANAANVTSSQIKKAYHKSALLVRARPSRPPGLVPKGVACARGS